MRRLLSAAALATVLLLGAMTPTFAHGRMATHTGNCGHASTSQSHANLRTGAHWTKTCPPKRHPSNGPTAPVPVYRTGPITPSPIHGPSSGPGGGSTGHIIPSCGGSKSADGAGCPQANAR